VEKRGKGGADNMAIGRRLKNRYRLALVFKIYLAIIAAMITSSLINYWLINFMRWNPVASHLTAISVGALTTVWAVFHLARRDERPGNAIRKSLKLMGEGNLCQLIRLDKRNMLADIADSINQTNQELSGKLRSVVKNLDRLTKVEEELSEQLQDNDRQDQYTKKLVCLMKISTSRIKNDLETFSLEEEKAIQN
jgi:methyl-accepting chemotaxis protein